MFKLLQKSLLLRLGLAMGTITGLAFVGMLSSVIIAETSEGQAAAINQAGTLRMQSYRIATEMSEPYTVLGETRNRRTARLVKEFEERLRSPRLTGVLARNDEPKLRKVYQGVVSEWNNTVLPVLNDFLKVSDQVESGEATIASLDLHRERYLMLVDGFVNNIDHMVGVLEEEAEKKIELLRLIQIVSLFLTIIVVVITMYMMNTKVLTPLRELLGSASAVRRGNFTTRVQYSSEDELGQLSSTFNTMSDDLLKMYSELEQRVNEKTMDLERSNRSLELLYTTTRQLNEAPISDSVYESLLRDIERLAETGPGSICLGQDGRNQAFKLATTRPTIFDKPDICNPPNCAGCFGDGETHMLSVDREPERALHVFSTPIKDTETQYGVLLVETDPEDPLKPWQKRLLETVASHIAIAINMTQRTSQARQLALLEERTVIARELHDSLAQSLTYLKIQVSRLDAELNQHEQNGKSKEVVHELREGLNSAYRQLRELLTTFRLRMDENGLSSALDKTVNEFRERSNIEIELDNRIGNCKLSPNAEIHVIQIIREALSNVVRHAHAKHAVISASSDMDGDVLITIDDDGVGMPKKPAKVHHYGLTIMKERAQGLGAELCILKSALGGTRVELSFSATGRWKKLTPENRETVEKIDAEQHVNHH